MVARSARSHVGLHLLEVVKQGLFFRRCDRRIVAEGVVPDAAIARAQVADRGFDAGEPAFEVRPHERLSGVKEPQDVKRAAWRYPHPLAGQLVRDVGQQVVANDTAEFEADWIDGGERAWRYDGQGWPGPAEPAGAKMAFPQPAG